ncbi:MAG TPA: CHAT domain-containing protein, partial [Pyrinomonadaceae bacterium]|nr:CHAT domain-containing protein [Pyrinomonadaceae bacterium]
SASVWNFLTVKKSKELRNALLIGFADEKIPLVNQEIETLSEIFPKKKSFVGDKANFASFIKNAAKFDILHLACHGQFRPENPLFSSLHLADGWITVRDICSQKLNAGLVTLSACETGLNKIFAGDEILGLARGFLSAGASSLVLSLWTVSDEATAQLMKDFYKNLQRGSSISASLAGAQRNFIRREVHPYFWSPFALIGK